MPQDNYQPTQTANLYDGGVLSYDGTTSGHLFLWITLTMMWVVMILAIMALLKYITQEGSTRKRK